MIHRVIQIKDWVVDFLFAVKDYDREGVLACLYEIGAPSQVLSRASSIMQGHKYNRGFTYGNPNLRRALVVIGPTTSGKQFQNTVAHEIDHLADIIATDLGVKYEQEGTAYLVGDTTMVLSDIVCHLGCDCVR